MTNRPRQPQTITLSRPYPLLDPGEYIARCSDATFAWAGQWKKWIARLVLVPENYTGRPYQGQLCRFLGLGGNRERPFAGQHSTFRQLCVEVNGAQPTGFEIDVKLFEGYRYAITVETVTRDRKDKERTPEHWYSIVRKIHLAPPSNTSTLNPLTLQHREPRQPINRPTQQHGEHTPDRAERSATSKEAFSRTGDRQ